MDIQSAPLEEYVAIARKIGWGAADILRSYYHQQDQPKNLEVQESKDGPVTAADVAANHYILDNLIAAFGQQDFGYLSEETFKAQSPEERLRHDWVWIIDPLDGTRDFIDRTGEFAVHIALAYQGRPVVAVVVCPELGKLFYATKGGGTFLETPDGATRPLKVSERSQPAELSLVVSRTHRDDRFKNLLSQLPITNQHVAGSVGGKIAAIVEQKADVYISLSGKSAPKDWDFAAPELVLTEAGGQWTHFDGRPLTYNNPDVSQWGGQLASNGTCHADLCAQSAQILAVIDAA